MCAHHENSAVDFTFESAQGSRSSIDHFVISDNLKEGVVDLFSVHEGDNLSDHSPLFIRFDLEVTCINFCSEVSSG